MEGDAVEGPINSRSRDEVVLEKLLEFEMFHWSWFLLAEKCEFKR